MNSKSTGLKSIAYELNLSILDETIMWISNLRGGQQ